MGMHQCSACKKAFEWNAQSAWYGSVLQLEEGSVEKACSIECGKKLWGSQYPSGYKFDDKNPVLKAIRRNNHD